MLKKITTAYYSLRLIINDQLTTLFLFSLVLVCALITLCLLFAFKHETIDFVARDFGPRSDMVAVLKEDIPVKKALKISQALKSSFPSINITLAYESTQQCYISTRIKGKKEDLEGNKIYEWHPMARRKIRFIALWVAPVKEEFKVFHADKVISSFISNEVSPLMIRPENDLSLNEEQEFYLQHVVSGLKTGPYYYEEGIFEFEGIEEEDDEVDEQKTVEPVNYQLLANILSRHSALGVSFSFNSENFDTFRKTNEESSLENKVMLYYLISPIIEDKQYIFIANQLFNDISRFNFNFNDYNFKCKNGKNVFINDKIVRVAGHYYFQPDKGLNPNVVLYRMNETQGNKVNQLYMGRLDTDSDIDFIYAKINHYLKSEFADVVDDFFITDKQNTKVQLLELSFASVILTFIGIIFFVSYSLVVKFINSVRNECFIIRFFGGKFHLLVILIAIKIFLLSLLICYFLMFILVAYINNILEKYDFSLFLYPINELMNATLIVLFIWVFIWGYNMFRMCANYQKK
jgi:hypothetical protein